MNALRFADDSADADDQSLLSSWFSIHEAHDQKPYASPWGVDDEGRPEEEWMDYLMFHHRMDNLSFLCDQYAAAMNTDQCSAEDCPVALGKILRWIKLIVLRVARSYYAYSFVLVVPPLIAGLLVGYWLGQRQATTTTRSKGVNKTSANYHVLVQWTSWMASMFQVAMSFLSLVLYRIKSSLGWILPTSSDSTDTKTTPLIYANNESFNHISNINDDGALSGTRKDLRSKRDTFCESGIAENQLPRHIAVIMDGNRRFGKANYNNATEGHEAGGRKVMELCKWCIAEKIKAVTLFAFSTENWKRDPREVSALMNIFVRHCHEMLEEAKPRNIRVRFLCTDPVPLPLEVKQGIRRLEEDTRECTGLVMNICLSYGSRDEIVKTSRQLAADCASGKLQPHQITETTFGSQLLTHDSDLERYQGDPDILIRTSGELRISNFLLWQLAYAEFFFLDKSWPEFSKDDLLDIIRSYAGGRERRFGR